MVYYVALPIVSNRDLGRTLPRRILPIAFEAMAVSPLQRMANYKDCVTHSALDREEKTMEQPLFRKESLERVSSPEQLSDYLHVTSPAIWIVLAAVILLLASLFVWSSVTALESYATGRAEVRGGMLTLSFDDAEKAENVQVGMNVKVGSIVTPVLSIGRDEDGRLLAVAEAGLPDGSYEARVGYRSTQIINMLFN